MPAASAFSAGVAGNPARRRAFSRFPRVFRFSRVAHLLHPRHSVTPGRIGWIAVLTTLTLVGAPVSVLASHSQCETQHHSCKTVVVDDCCCGHLSGSESQQPAPSNSLAATVSVTEPPAAAPASSLLWSPVHEMVTHLDHLVIDRLTLFKVFLI